MRRFVSLALLTALASILGLHPTSAQEAKVQKLVFASAGFEDSNRFWMVARPEHLQFDPFLETLLDVDPKTGEFVPRLAEKWQGRPDKKKMDFLFAQGGSIPQRLWRIHRQGCGAFPLAYADPRCHRDLRTHLAPSGGDQSHR